MHIIATATLALVLSGSPGQHEGAHSRVLGPIECGSQRCHQSVTVTRPYLDTGQTVTLVKRHSRPTESRNSLTPPWGPWHLQVAYVSGSAGAARVRPADPCFFSAPEFDAWYDGIRWGASLDTVENQYANCTGSWQLWGEVWNGHDTKLRVWPRPDGGQTQIVFAHFDTGATWRAHSHAWTFNTNTLGGTEWRKECEWPRQGSPC
jgi:hypothetical protein